MKGIEKHDGKMDKWIHTDCQLLTGSLQSKRPLKISNETQAQKCSGSDQKL